jgi:hydrogenase maturation factor
MVMPMSKIQEAMEHIDSNDLFTQGTMPEHVVLILFLTMGKNFPILGRMTVKI